MSTRGGKVGSIGKPIPIQRAAVKSTNVTPNRPRPQDTRASIAKASYRFQVPKPTTSTSNRTVDKLKSTSTPILSKTTKPRATQPTLNQKPKTESVAKEAKLVSKWLERDQRFGPKLVETETPTANTEAKSEKENEPTTKSEAVEEKTLLESIGKPEKVSDSIESLTEISGEEDEDEVEEEGEDEEDEDEEDEEDEDEEDEEDEDELNEKDKVESCESNGYLWNFALLHSKEKSTEIDEKDSLNMLMKRKREISCIISLNKVKTRLFDSPPFNYETFIRLYGRRNMKQASVQTVSVSDVQIQTENIKTKNKSSQWPSSRLGLTCDEDSPPKLPQFMLKDVQQFREFMQRATKIVVNLLPESMVAYCSPLNYPTIAFETSSLQSEQNLSSIYYKGGHIFAVHSMINLNASLVSIWSTKIPSRPEYLLKSRSLVVKLAIKEEFLVFAACFDGSIAVWDIREPDSYHPPSNNNSFVVNHLDSIRSPSFLTSAGEIHPSLIIEMIYQEQNDYCESGRLLVVDESYVISFWSAQDTVESDFSLTESGQGMNPLSCVKLIKTLVLHLSEGLLQAQLRSPLISFDILPYEVDSFLIASLSDGVYLHSSRNKLSKRESLKEDSFCYQFLVDGMKLAVAKMKANPWQKRTFFVAYKDATICLYSCSKCYPIRVWSPTETGWTFLIDLQWISSDTIAVLDQDRGICSMKNTQDRSKAVRQLIGDQNVTFFAAHVDDFDELTLVYGNSSTKFFRSRISYFLQTFSSTRTF